MTKPPVVLLAAGESSRMYPLETYPHKSLITMGGKSLLEHTVDGLIASDYQELIFITSPVGVNSEKITNLKHTYPDINTTVITQPEAKGMGNALLQAQSLLQSQFIVAAPYHIEVAHVLDQLLMQPTEAVVCGQETDEPWNFGILELKDNYARGLVEKPARGQEPSTIKIALAYLLNQHFLQLLEKTPDTPYNFEIALDQLMKQETVAFVKLDQELHPLKYPWHLLEIQQAFLQRLTATSTASSVSATAVFDEAEGPVIIEAGATIGDFVKIIGPSYIGKSTHIGDFSFVRNSVIEEGSVVGANTEVVRSLILPRATVHSSYVADSIIGEGTTIGAGLITANKRLDGHHVRTLSQDRMVGTNKRKLGLITGSHVNLGISVKTMPGVLLGQQTVVYPSVIVSKNTQVKQVVTTDL